MLSYPRRQQSEYIPGVGVFQSRVGAVKRYWRVEVSRVASETAVAVLWAPVFTAWVDLVAPVFTARVDFVAPFLAAVFES